MILEAFLDLFNMLQPAGGRADRRQLHLQTGPRPIVNGTPVGSEVRQGHLGAPIVKNPNYGHALLYQRPFNGRFGLRLTF